MQIKLISYSESKLVSLNPTHEIISNKIKNTTGITEQFLYCNTQKEMFMGIKQGIEEADIILLAVDVSKFISTKAALFRAMGFKCKLNAKIIELINSDSCMATLNEKQTNAHAAIPVGGEAFITSDGLFSGLGIKEGRQKLIFVPIDEKRINSIIENGMLAFLADGIEENIFEDIIDEVRAEVVAEEIPEVICEEVNEVIQEETSEEVQEETPVEEQEEICVKIEEQPEEEEVKEEVFVSDIPAGMEGYVEHIDAPVAAAPAANPEYIDIYSATPVMEKINEESVDVETPSVDETALPYDQQTDFSAKTDITKAVENITSKGFSIAFVRQMENVVYTNLLAQASVAGVQFVDFPADRTLTEDVRRKETVASNARKAMKQTNSSFAVSMSEIFYGEDNVGYIFVTLADSQKSSVYKIFAADGETEEDLYKIGFESVLERMEDITKKVNFRPVQPLQSEPVSDNDTGKKKISSTTLIVIWVFVIIAVGTLTVLILDVALTKNASAISSATQIMNDLKNVLLR